MARRPWFLMFAGQVARLALAGLVVAGAFLVPRAYGEVSQRAARLSYLEGSVTVDRVNNTGSDTALLNMPLGEGQRISTGEDGQAEVEFEDGSLIRLMPYSSVSLDSMTADSEGNFQTRMSVVSGLVYAELRATPQYAYQLVAGGDDISPVENATVRVNMDQPPAVIAVFSGAVYVEGGDSQTGYRTEVRAGENFTEDQLSQGHYLLTQQITEDSWDSWNLDRDQQAAEEAASRTTARDGYVGQQGYGWSDLDTNGTWYDVPGQGPVWQPAIAVNEGFDPYGYGSWVWYRGAGYVWASGYPWGWTPYRCGSWSYWGGFGWGWTPGAACGFCGWGFGSGSVFAINIVHALSGYHFKPLPGHNPTGLHPIVVVRPGHGPAAPEYPPQGFRAIAGQIAAPLHPVGVPYALRGEGVTGAALRRDFPVDQGTNRPVLGTVRRPVINSRDEWNGIPAGSSEAFRQSTTPVRPVPPTSPGRSMITRPGTVSVPVETMSRPAVQTASPRPIAPARPGPPPSIPYAAPPSQPRPAPSPAPASHPSAPATASPRSNPR